MKNWKTTVLGVITAVIIAIAPILETGEVKWQALVLAAVVAAFGYFAKDHDVTGV